MHHWGDKEVDWQGIGDAAEFIGNYCARWGRFGGQTKEKYGTVRFYASFSVHNLINLTHPGYHYTWSIWQPYVKFDNAFGEYIVKYTLLQAFFSWWQPKVYRKAYKLALLRWPHLREEILCCADYPEFLEGL